MALLDKIGEFAKIAANKTEEITKTIGEKAEAALEIQKLTSLVGKEESKIESTYKKMGKMVWEKSQNCDCLPDEFKEECEAIKASLAAIDDLKFKIANIKATAFNGDEPKTTCPNCGAAVGISAKFCSECGSKMEPVETAKTVEAEVVSESAEHKTEAEAEVEVITEEPKTEEAKPETEAAEEAKPADKQ
ncbi:zinc ribbon domain-containing protein [Phascolarctobacterium faecium]|nr:zinc ribbon domain-containing protein [Phascolarctobacterium faecium]MDM8109154.1 zinc ribbon domain-containing protein [Phascolarctobacterium faecium]